jgi:NADP-dependent 3-hydroxy acid dehydrogenase YdfG
MSGPGRTAAPDGGGDLWRLDGRVALVTGASAGLGARFARVLHQAGARVLVTARHDQRRAIVRTDWGKQSVVTEPIWARDDQ